MDNMVTLLQKFKRVGAVFGLYDPISVLGQKPHGAITEQFVVLSHHNAVLPCVHT
jgi:hypothetical protein